MRFIRGDRLAKRHAKATQGVDISDIDGMRRAAVRLGFKVNITGDVCTGDEVVFSRAVFSGSFRNARYEGHELVEGKIIRDSYGADKQQHTFTIETRDGDTVRIKGRNLYRVGCFCRNYDRPNRKENLEEKHNRGDKARADRYERRKYEEENRMFL